VDKQPLRQVRDSHTSLASAARPIDDTLWDVAVVGAGPAGTSAATCLASAGHSVLLLDKHAFPRDKVCGDALIPDALNCLRQLGLYDLVRSNGHALDHLTVYSPSRIRVQVPAECVTLKRERFDKLLLDAALDRGATFRVASVKAVHEAPNGQVYLTVGGEGTTARARIGIMATGANVSLLAPLRLVHQARASAIALRCYVRSRMRVDELIVSFDRSITPGYGWIFPLGGGEYNVGCGVFYGHPRAHEVNLREAFDTFTRRMPIARELVARADAVSPLRGARLRSGLGGASCHNGGSLLCIGETIGATFPFTGEGIGKAMETGLLAARQAHRSIEAGNATPLTQFPELLERDLAPRYTGYQIAERWMSRPWLNDLLAIRIRTSASLRTTVSEILNETADPRTVFSWKTFLPRWARSRPRREVA